MWAVREGGLELPLRAPVHISFDVYLTGSGWREHYEDCPPVLLVHKAWVFFPVWNLYDEASRGL